ncbi:MAG: hypothetical protein HND52_07785 [Ignavibacteriae bacterium]|nr:hypothetical protein [Ignavibacteriota bacterium]NOG97847.1 hypothetical protein [Ignavibacteriota bacterium]
MTSLIKNNKHIALIFFSMAVLFFAELKISAQDILLSQKNYADSLFDESKYFDAITEYKRLLFFDETNQFEFDANFKIGMSYKLGAKYSNSIKYLRLAQRAAEANEETFKSKIEIVKVNILRKTFSAGKLLLNQIEKDERFTDRTDEINYWRGWLRMLSDDWEGASESFAAIDSLHPLKTLSDNVVDEKYSVTFAKVISYILPGSGQFYSGKYLSGLMSLGWNIFAGYLTVNSFLEDRVFDGIIIGNLLWLRFYNGNIQNAEKFALEKNINISNKALRYLKNNYEGKKP